MKVTTPVFIAIVELIQTILLIRWSFVTHWPNDAVLLAWIINCELTIWIGHLYRVAGKEVVKQ